MGYARTVGDSETVSVGSGHEGSFIKSHRRQTKNHRCWNSRRRLMEIEYLRPGCRSAFAKIVVGEPCGPRRLWGLLWGPLVQIGIVPYPPMTRPGKKTLTPDPSGAYRATLDGTGQIAVPLTCRGPWFKLGASTKHALDHVIIRPKILSSNLTTGLFTFLSCRRAFTGTRRHRHRSCR